MISTHIDAFSTVLNAHFRIEPCSSCPIAGYFIVSPRVPVSSLSQLSSEAQASLGSTLATVTRAIEVVVRPKRVYCLLFAEETLRFIFIYFREQIGYFLSMRAAIRPMARFRGRGFSIGRARHFDLPLARTIIRPLKQFFVQSTVTSNKSLEPAAGRCDD